jgi:hypothetical protein
VVTAHREFTYRTEVLHSFVGFEQKVVSASGFLSAKGLFEQEHALKRFSRGQPL